MNERDRIDEDGDDDSVAAEYVLGLLEGARRVDAARRVETDPGFARLVSAWEERLSGMNEAYGAVEPPDSVWAGVEARLFPEQQAATARSGFWQNVVLWRGLAFSATVVALVLAAFLMVSGIPPAAGPEYVASLSSAETEAAFLAVETGDGKVRVTRTGAEPPSGRVHELWVIAGEDAPRSLGVLAERGSTSVSLPADLAGLAPDALVLAVSVEPPGGSPTGKVTGPVVAAGPLKKI